MLVENYRLRRDHLELSLPEGMIAMFFFCLSESASIASHGVFAFILVWLLVVFVSHSPTSLCLNV